MLFSCILCDSARAEKTLDIEQVKINGTTLKQNSEGVYSGTITSAQHLTVAIFSNYESLTEYNLKCTISFSYPQTVASYLNVTPFYHDLKDGNVYLAEIGKINSSSGSALTYHKKSYYDEQQPYLPAFNHGGYLCGPFGGSAQFQTLVTDLTYQFQNNTVDYMGLYMECGNSGSTGLSMFPTSQRNVTITIDYFDAVEKATIENAETTKNIFEWLQDGFVSLIVPTSDGIEDMLDNTSNTLESRLGILYLPIEFTGNMLGTLSASIENADSGQSISVPAWDMSLFGRTYKLWNQTSFSITDNAIFQHIISNSTTILLLRIVYIVALFNAIFKTIDVLTDGMYDDEFAEIVTDNGEGENL